MGTRSLQSDSNPRRRRSFTLSSFRKTHPGESQQALATSASAAAQEAERVRKAAAWQWYTRGVGELVVPTKRPAAAAGGASASTAVKDTAGRAILVGGDQESAGGPKPSLQESRFKVEASARGRAPPTTASANPAIAAASPLYDEVELSALTAQMADFVQRMQRKQQSQLEAVMPPAPAEAPHRPPPPPSPPEAETAGIRKSISSSSARVSGFRRPISALHRFLRQLISGSSYKSSSAAATSKVPNDEGNLGPEPAADDVQYHYHHYIHHHHHHYHNGHSPEEAEFNSRRRRYSESSGIRARIPLIWEEIEEDVKDDDNEKSPSLIAFLSRRRRHSDSAFAEVRKVGSMADHDGGKVVKQAMDKAARPAKPAAEPQLPARRFSSERFTSKEWKDEGQGGWRSGADVRSRRRHSAEEAVNYGWWSGGEAAMEGGSRAASGGGMGGGVYKLSGVDANHIERKPVGGRRAFGKLRQASRRSCS